MKRSFLLITALCCLLTHQAAVAEEFKCLAKDNSKKLHVILVDTSDIKDARRAALASTVNNSFNRPSPVENVLECKRENEQFRSPRGRVIDGQTAR